MTASRLLAAGLSVLVVFSSVAPAAAQMRPAAPFESAPPHASPIVRVSAAGMNGGPIAPLTAPLADVVPPGVRAAAEGPEGRPAEPLASAAPSARLEEDGGVLDSAVSGATDLARTSDARAAAAKAAIARVVSEWGAPHPPSALHFRRHHGPASAGKDRLVPAAAGSSTAKTPVPGPSSGGGPTGARPGAARAALVSGSILVGAAAVAFAVPALIPAAAAVAKGPALWIGLGLMGLSRYWKTPSAGAESPRGPPAPHPAPQNWIRFIPFHDVWFAALDGAAQQTHLEELVGASSGRRWRNWFLGGLRAGVQWFPVGLVGVLLGPFVSKPFVHLVHATNDVGMISLDALEKVSLGGHLLGYVASAFAAEAAALAAFDGTAALARRFGAGRAAPWIAGALALAVSAALILPVTTAPAVIAPLLFIEATALWLRVRSDSWVAPFALRGLFALFTLEASRFEVWMVMGKVGKLAGLPDGWVGAAIAGMLLGALAWSARSLRPSELWRALKAQARRISDFGTAWLTPTADGAPHSPWPLLKLAALWAVVNACLGDVVPFMVHAVSGGTEAVPELLLKMLTCPIDLNLYNLVLVACLEELMFRRGLFKWVYALFEKHRQKASWRLSARQSLWASIVASGLLFSGFHHVNWDPLLAKLHIDAAASGVSMHYNFSWPSFVGRTVMGMALAWQYVKSGTLLLPIASHFLVDAMISVGLHWGFAPFLGLVAATLLLQFGWKKLRRR